MPQLEGEHLLVVFVIEYGHEEQTLSCLGIIVNVGFSHATTCVVEGGNDVLRIGYDGFINLHTCHNVHGNKLQTIFYVPSRFFANLVHK